MADGTFYKSFDVIFIRDIASYEDRVATRSMNMMNCFFATICVDVSDNHASRPFASEGLCRGPTDT